MNITPVEALILSLLQARPAGAYPSELLRVSEGKLKRGSIYTMLQRMEESGLVKGKEEPPTDAYALPRTIYKITGAGVRARNDFGVWTGLVPAGGLA